MTRIPIKEEDIEIIKREFDTHDSDGNDRIGYEYYLKISDTPYMEKQEAEALKQQLLDDHEKARERDFYKEVADERKEVVEKLEQQVKKLQIYRYGSTVVPAQTYDYVFTNWNTKEVFVVTRKARV